MKCIRCLKEAVHEALCEKCYTSGYINIISFNKFVLKLCSDCRSYMYGKSWKPPLSLQEAIRKSCYDSMVFKKKPIFFETKGVFPQYTNNKGTKVNGMVTITTEVEIQEITEQKNKSKKKLVKKEQFEYPLQLRFTSCDTCARNQSGYFEGILQLRNDKNKEFTEVVKFVRNKIKNKKGIHITSALDVKNGVDFYITSKRVLPGLAKDIVTEFGGEIKISEQLFTRDNLTSRDVYRVNALVRLLDFNRKDILQFKDEKNKNVKLLYVTKITDKVLFGIDLDTNKKTKVNYLDQDYEIIATPKDYIKVEIIRKKPVLEVLHPVTYQPVTIANPFETKRGKISVIEINGRLYMVEY